VSRGTVVVSAYQHEGIRWYPGAITGALGVVMDPGQPRDSVTALEIDGHPVVRASPYPRPIPGVPPERNLNGISFAVANATGVLARMMEDAGEARTAEEAMKLVSARWGPTGSSASDTPPRSPDASGS
jgi:hypothetical protein